MSDKAGGSKIPWDNLSVTGQKYGSAKGGCPMPYETICLPVPVVGGKRAL